MLLRSAACKKLNGAQGKCGSLLSMEEEAVDGGAEVDLVRVENRFDLWVLCKWSKYGVRV